MYLYKYLFIIAIVIEYSNANNNGSTETSLSKVGRNANDNDVKKHSELCPIEYRSCTCKNEYSHKNTISIIINCNEHKKHFNENGGSTKKFHQITSIPKINTTIFPSAHHITYLDLSNTPITEIPTDAFHGLTGLHTVIISHCPNLTVIKMFAFRGLKSLKSLIITNNQNLKKIDPNAFGSLKNLDFLSLSKNSLSEIDGHIFQVSNSIHTIDFIGNPIRRIKSYAFQGLRNVNSLIISTTENVTPIETIEADSFISTAFVQYIYLQGIHTKTLITNSFRGLSNCKVLDLSNSDIEQIEADTFFGTNNIDKLNFSTCRLRNIDSKAFNNMHNTKSIDLSRNYISKINETTFSFLINETTDKNEISSNSSKSLRLMYSSGRYQEKRLIFDKNPIQCDCNLNWIFKDANHLDSIQLPEICAGPKGYDCLGINEVTVKRLACSNNQNTALVNQMNQTLPCDKIVYNINKQKYSVDLQNDTDFDANSIGEYNNITDSYDSDDDTKLDIIKDANDATSKITPVTNHNNINKPPSSSISSQNSKKPNTHNNNNDIIANKHSDKSTKTISNSIKINSSKKLTCTLLLFICLIYSFLYS